MSFKYYLPFCFLCVLICQSVFASATKIVAVVGDELISSMDVQRRIAIVTRELGVSVDEVSERFIQDVLRVLIDESVLFSKAEALGIRVSSEEDDKLWDDAKNKADAYESATHKQAGDASVVLDKNSFYKRVKARLLWSKIIGKYVSPEVAVSKKEVEDYKEQIRNSGSKSVKIRQVVIPSGISASTLKMITQKAKGAASLSKLAEQFSYKLIALDWIPWSQLSPEIRTALEGLEVGQVSPVVAMQNGLSTIVALEDQSELSAFVLNSKVSFFELLASKRSVLERLKGMAKDCDGKIPDFGPEVEVSRLISGRVKDFTAGIKDLIASTRPLTISAPEKDERGGEPGDKKWRAVLLCSAVDGVGSFSDDEIVQGLFNQKLLVRQKFYLDQMRNSVPCEIIDEKGV